MAQISECRKDLFWSTVSEHSDPASLVSWVWAEHLDSIGSKQRFFLLFANTTQTVRQVMIINCQGLSQVTFFLWIGYTSSSFQNIQKCLRIKCSNHEIIRVISYLNLNNQQRQKVAFESTPALIKSAEREELGNKVIILLFYNSQQYSECNEFFQIKNTSCLT